MSNKPKSKHGRKNKFRRLNKAVTAPAAPVVPMARKSSLLRGLLSMVLTTAGLVGLVALLPRLSAAQQSPFISGDQIPSVTVTNDGVVRVTDVKILCFIEDMKVGGSDFHLFVGGLGAPSQNVLGPGEPYTVSCSKGVLLSAPTSTISSIDLCVVAYYRPWPFTLRRSRKFFRFVGRNDGSTLNWFKQPPGDAEEVFDKHLKAKGLQF